tara:strand:+ start:118 stop:492 length:375 start_codon:yes stop_codon:yes gene_type:complete
MNGFDENGAASTMPPTTTTTPHSIVIPQRRRSTSFFAPGGHLGDGDDKHDIWGSNAAWGDGDGDDTFDDDGRGDGDDEDDFVPQGSPMSLGSMDGMNGYIEHGNSNSGLETFARPRIVSEVEDW